jgi:ribosomal protein L1
MKEEEKMGQIEWIWQTKEERIRAPVGKEYYEKKDVLPIIRKRLKELSELSDKELKEHIICFIDLHSVEHDADALW